MFMWDFEMEQMLILDMKTFNRLSCVVLISTDVAALIAPEIQ